MTDDPSRPRIDLRQPNMARIHDYLLGGSLNNSHDRMLATSLHSVFPAITRFVPAQRTFQQRSVQYMLDHGARQFIVLKSGLPTMGHVHHTAQAIATETAVVYVDDDSDTVAQADIILKNVAMATIIQADPGNPAEVLDGAAPLIDDEEPVGIVAVGAFDTTSHRISPSAILEHYRHASRMTTYLAITLLAESPALGSADQLRQAARILRAVDASLSPWPPGTVNSWLRHAGFEVVPGGLPPLLNQPESVDAASADQPWFEYSVARFTSTH